jgi:hypothetical protein
MELSRLDVAVLLLTGLLAWASWNIHREFGLAVAFVVGHFFLFCNVFRIGRKYELVWAALFALNMVAAASFGRWSWTTGMLGQLAVTVPVFLAQNLRRRRAGLLSPFRQRLRPGDPVEERDHIGISRKFLDHT